MSVTTSTPNLLTLIQENGSTPTGAGGNLIDQNFRRLDNLFISNGSDWFAKRASFANTASYATMAQYVSGAVSSTVNASYANHTGFTTDFNSYAPSDYAGTLHSIAVWGSKGTPYGTSGSMYNLVNTAALPSYGPFGCKVLVGAYNTGNQSERVYAECFVFGWNLGITAIKVLHAYDASGTEITLTPNIGITHKTTGNNIYFYVENTQLKCAVSMASAYMMGVQMTALSIFPTDSLGS